MYMAAKALSPKILFYKRITLRKQNTRKANRKTDQMVIIVQKKINKADTKLPQFEPQQNTIKHKDTQSMQPHVGGLCFWHAALLC